MKIKYAMKTQDDIVFLINSELLYKQICEQKIPYHEWHSWLKKQYQSLVTKMKIEASKKMKSKIQNMNSIKRTNQTNKNIQIYPVKNSNNNLQSKFQKEKSKN